MQNKTESIFKHFVHYMVEQCFPKQITHHGMEYQECCEVRIFQKII